MHCNFSKSVNKNACTHINNYGMPYADKKTVNQVLLNKVENLWCAAILCVILMSTHINISHDRFVLRNSFHMESSSDVFNSSFKFLAPTLWNGFVDSLRDFLSVFIPLITSFLFFSNTHRCMMIMTTLTEGKNAICKQVCFKT